MKDFQLRDSQGEPEDVSNVWEDASSMPSVNLVGFIPVRDHQGVNKPLEIHVNDIGFICHPMSLEDSTGEASTGGEAAKVTSFNVVFAVSRKALQKDKVDVLKKCILQISTVLKREEQRIGYLSKECQKMFKVRETWLRAQTLGPEQRPDHSMLCTTLLDTSTLALELSRIYDGLNEDGYFYVKIGNWITLSLTLNPPVATLSLMPFQTILVTSPTLTLPPDASPDIVRFIQACKPSKSFQDMQMELNLSLAQIYRMAAHVLYWQLGKVISTMKTQNVYCINPKCAISKSLKDQFTVDFPGLSLLQELKRFSFPKPVKDHLLEISMSPKLFSEVLVWFLRRDLVIQLFTYLLLSLPNVQQNEEKLPSTVRELMDDDGMALLTEEELNYISEVASEKTSLDMVFRRLCYYARGSYHIDEIAWRENILYEDIEKILTNPKYQCIVTFQTESDTCV